MKGQGLVLSLMIGLVAMEEEFRKPPLPMFTSLQIRTSEDSDDAQISVEYLAPEKPFALWFVNGLPVREERMDYRVINDFNQRGITIMSSLRDKQSHFGVCLQNVVAQICLYLRPLLPNAVRRQRLSFPWPLLIPGPLYRYEADENVKIHVPELDTPFNYTYSAVLYSKDPQDEHGRLVIAETHGMLGGNEDDVVTIDREDNNKTGWVMRVPTNGSFYEGVLMVNTTFVIQHGMNAWREGADLVQACSLFRPFSIYYEGHSAAFDEGFVTPVPMSAPWRCRLHVDCMVLCPFLSNGEVNVTIARMNPRIVSVLNAEELPLEFPEGEEEPAVIRMLGPYFGYGYVFIPDFVPSRDAGTYKCTFKTQTMAVGISSSVEVN